MAMIRYTQAGRYVAVCPNATFTGHRLKSFDFPGEHSVTIPEGADAAWYFLNRVDGVSMLELVFPVALLGNVKEL